MNTDDPEKHRLDHDLKNAKQEKLALQSLLKRAADELDDLADAECSEAAKQHAEQTASRLRRASSL